MRLKIGVLAFLSIFFFFSFPLLSPPFSLFQKKKKKAAICGGFASAR
jgi:hypothetical protein